ncbi:MAG: Hsp33 family molecular chaperone HslO, partial [Lentisphaeria bacterium]|nr:Hsp33 family molecular chaperone HslO [Lentisphaeria bacterium]NQZ67583.1 Hsp33 family molecular chaperone HslO [Lentisphaeria bacterium]
MSNILLRGLIEKVNIRFSYALITDLANEVIIKQNCDPVAAHIFSRCLTAATLSNPLLGDDERLTIRWQYEDQPLESIIVEVLEDGAVRGTISPPSLNEFMGQADNIKEICGDSC